mmetsp:Transcript_13177/g.42924  ORF Transcript_13177/g.42924 Transcript_13177/m.42924 type:complete len:410 (+) Transcript_13177:26-1255(+)
MLEPQPPRQKGVRFPATKEGMERMAVVVEVGDSASEAYDPLKRWLGSVGLTPGTGACVLVSALVLVALVVSSSSSTAPARTGAEWSPTWDLEREVYAASARAAAKGVVAARVLEKKTVVVEEPGGGLPFHVYLVQGRLQKNTSSVGKTTTKEEDPLDVGNVAPSMVVRRRVFDDEYALILNKFPLFRGHTLLVTSAGDVPQSHRVGKRDLDALHRSASALKGLGFFNSHADAGSSQPHRHFQLIPFASMEPRSIFQALDAAMPDEPTWRWSSKAPFIPVVKYLAPFDEIAHGLVRLPPRATFDIDFQNKGTFADALLRAYVALAADLHIFQDTDDRPHNLVLTERCLFAVRRSQPRASHHFNISANAMAFTGTIVTDDPEAFQHINQTFTPLDVLRDVAVPAIALPADK